MKKGYSEAIEKVNLSASARRQGVQLDIQEAHFDSGMAADPATSEDFENPVTRDDDDILPADFEKISQLASKFPEIYASRLEAYLMQQKLCISRLRKDNESYIQENNLLKEETQQNKFLIQQLTAALQKSSGQKELENFTCTTDNFQVLN